MLEVVNEPVQDSNQVGAMRSSYYPNAFSVSLFPHGELLYIVTKF